MMYFTRIIILIVLFIKIVAAKWMPVEKFDGTCLNKVGGGVEIRCNKKYFVKFEDDELKFEMPSSCSNKPVDVRLGIGNSVSSFILNSGDTSYTSATFHRSYGTYSDGKNIVALFPIKTDEEGVTSLEFNDEEDCHIKLVKGMFVEQRDDVSETGFKLEVWHYWLGVIAVAVVVAVIVYLIYWLVTKKKKEEDELETGEEDSKVVQKYNKENYKKLKHWVQTRRIYVPMSCHNKKCRKHTSADYKFRKYASKCMTQALKWKNTEDEVYKQIYKKQMDDEFRMLYKWLQNYLYSDNSACKYMKQNDGGKQSGRQAESAMVTGRQLSKSAASEAAKSTIYYLHTFIFEKGDELKKELKLKYTGAKQYENLKIWEDENLVKLADLDLDGTGAKQRQQPVDAQPARQMEPSIEKNTGAKQNEDIEAWKRENLTSLRGLYEENKF